jgi:hypothetical protein
MFFLSYGGGVNSTALAILMVRGKLPQYDPWRIVFADTGDEQPGTYAFIKDHFEPWLEAHGRKLETVRADETVLERWEKLQVTGSRMLRACTEKSKIIPVKLHIEANGGGISLLGVDAGEDHRMPGSVRPLVDLGINRAGCEEIIKVEGLPSPGKSGCWHCPFMRVGEVIKLAKLDPCKFERIERLENAATAAHGLQPDGQPRTQWGGKTASYWRGRANQGDIFYDEWHLSDEALPCACHDG